MKRNNKKGFTIVELVIVIAVIGILAGVLIPTFSGIIGQANQSAADQAARNGFNNCYSQDLSDGKLDGMNGDVEITDDGYDHTVPSYTATKNDKEATYGLNGFVD